jgi:hypothetical protein
MSEPLPGKDRFHQAYEGKAPWGIGKPHHFESSNDFNFSFKVLMRS